MQNTLFLHITGTSLDSERFDKLHYIYQHFQECEKLYQTDPQCDTTIDENSLYLQINNDIEYGLFKDVVDSYYLDSQIKDDFKCDHNCYSEKQETNADHPPIACTHTYDHISQQITDLADSTQQETLYSMEQDASLFTTDSSNPCHFNIAQHDLDSDPTCNTSNQLHGNGIHAVSKHKYRNTFGEANIHYHDFDNCNSFNYKDKYTTLLQQELQNPYWCLHDRITTETYQISNNMDIETMPHAMYFTGNIDTVMKINQIPYQTITYNDNGMFNARLLDNTSVKIFIDNGATPSISPLCTYNKCPLLHTYPKTESNNHD